ncbi:MAG: RlmE family RNA methyltransferase [Alphaproteobacteria bacterium]|nr:RlmE family RNA methyltransferase [Alphaproteobacteria bacterium]
MVGPRRVAGTGAVKRRRGAVRVTKAKTASSRRWLERQLNDPYVQAARDEGYRSRAAYKLIELDERFGLLRPSAAVVDLGAAPGGWAQIAAQRARAGKAGGGTVVAVDLNPINAIEGVSFIQADALDFAVLRPIRAALGAKRADLVLSDMAAPATGHMATDHLRIMALCEAALDIAEPLLAPGGAFVAKVLKGGTERLLLERLKRVFRTVKHAKPPSSRADSAESYVVALGYRGSGEASGSPD